MKHGVHEERQTCSLLENSANSIYLDCQGGPTIGSMVHLGGLSCFRWDIYFF